MMSAEGPALAAARPRVATRGGDGLRTLSIASGVGASVLFVVVGLAAQLQLYADGALFSYAVAVQDAWAFHWHNIPGRALVYLYAHLPAEMVVALTGDPATGIALYGLLFFAAPLVGLGLTFLADCSRGRIFFVFACAATATLCPLVFGFPTEMWMAQALFFPALAVCHCARRNAGGLALVFVSLLALRFTHGGALILMLTILATLALRGLRDPLFLRAVAACVLTLLVWLAVRSAITPDPYVAEVLSRAAWHFFSPDIFAGALVREILAALAAYIVLALALRPRRPHDAARLAAAFVAVALVLYWLFFDHALHADNRYYLRTALVVLVPLFGVGAAAFALRTDGALKLRLPLLPRLLDTLEGRPFRHAAAGALALVLLVHAVETAKFVVAWTHYKEAVRRLAMSEKSDPALGDPRFVSSQRVDADPRLSWFSTTPFFTVLVAPGFAPARLVVDPTANYFWLACATATASEEAARALPRDARRLLRLYSCLHR
jgi:hypothetical protein